jgi:molybdopterin/thiamine biosynthesis adenylyltransferase
MNERYAGLVNNFDNYAYHFLGCGAIGSAAAVTMVKMGAKCIHLYDMDKVERPNVGVSVYDTNDINKDKVSALKDRLLLIDPYLEVHTHHGMFEQYKPEDNNVVILGFDSMESRLYAVEQILKHKKPDVLIDGRMGAEHYQQYTFKSPTLSQYKKTWYSDSEGDDEPCNAKATSYCSSMTGSFICNNVKKILKDEPYLNNFSFNFQTMALNSNGFVS